MAAAQRWWSRAAKSVCETLIFEGMGCDRQIFPIEARVEIDGKVVWRWTKEKGWRDIECEDPCIFEEKPWIEQHEALHKAFVGFRNENPQPKEYVIKIEPQFDLMKIYDKFNHPNSKSYVKKRSQRQNRKAARRNKK